jgi:hypothetical protein
MKVQLRVNDTLKQVGCVNEMLFSFGFFWFWVIFKGTWIDCLRFYSNDVGRGGFDIDGNARGILNDCFCYGEGVGPVKEGDTLVASLYCGNVLLDDATFTVQESK